MVHKRLGTPTLEWSIFQAKFHRQCLASWHVYFTADSQDVEQELQWACARPSALSRSSEDVQSRSLLATARNNYNYDGPFLTGLNLRELNWLLEYTDMFNRMELNSEDRLRGFVCMLGQNPRKHAQHNMGSMQLGTIIKNVHLAFSSYHTRWLTSRELLLTQGYPTFQHTAQPGQVSSWLRSRADFGLPPRKRTVIAEQAGNAMNLVAIGAAQL
eukprot:2489746-Alexandrium_andersonii.AAC.1